MVLEGKIAHTHNNETKSLIFIKRKTQERAKPKIARTVDHNCAYVTVMAVLMYVITTLVKQINSLPIQRNYLSRMHLHSVYRVLYKNCFQLFFQHVSMFCIVFNSSVSVDCFNEKKTIIIITI